MAGGREARERLRYAKEGLEHEMSDINSITVTGRLTRDPEMRQAGGQQVCRFSVACGRSWVSKSTGNREERTTFFDCEVWGTRGEALGRILRKGMQVTVSGSHESDAREQQDGSKRTYWTLKVSDVVLPPRGAQTPDSGAYSAPQGQPPMRAYAGTGYAATPQAQAYDAGAAYDAEIPF